MRYKDVIGPDGKTYQIRYPETEEDYEFLRMDVSGRFPFDEAAADVINRLKVVWLKTEFKGLSAGTEGVIVSQSDDGLFDVEFFDSLGDTIDVFKTPASVLEFSGDD